MLNVTSNGPISNLLFKIHDKLFIERYHQIVIIKGFEQSIQDVRDTLNSYDKDSSVEIIYDIRLSQDDIFCYMACFCCRALVYRDIKRKVIKTHGAFMSSL